MYASGTALGDKEQALELNGSNLSVETTETGQLNFFANSEQNARDWSTMMFTIRNGKVEYPGVATSEASVLPVAKGTKVSLDIANNTADFWWYNS